MPETRRTRSPSRGRTETTPAPSRGRTETTPVEGEAATVPAQADPITAPEPPPPLKRCARCMNEIRAGSQVHPIIRRARTPTGTDETVDWCYNCFVNYAGECGRCHVHCDTAAMVDVGGRYACRKCQTEAYWRCPDCRVWMLLEQFPERHCFACRPIILGNDADPDLNPVGGGDPKKTHYYGVELEMEVTLPATTGRAATHINRMAKLCLDLLPAKFAIAKHDGSVRQGYELVTRPATLEQQREHWTAFFEKRPPGLKSYDTSTCGLHIHTSRAPLTELTVSKIVCFVNASANRELIQTIAGRAAGEWATIAEKKLSQGAKYNQRRYEAVNLQNAIPRRCFREPLYEQGYYGPEFKGKFEEIIQEAAGTIEFRIFKGTLKPASFFKALDFVDALVHFCAPGTSSHQEVLVAEPFLTYVGHHRKLWPYLNAFLDARWFEKETKATLAMGWKVGRTLSEQGEGN